MAFQPDCEFERAAQLLAGNDDFRLLRRLQPVTSFAPVRPGAPSYVGVVLDTETTGLDHEGDKIIELAIQRFRYDELGRITEVGSPRVWREDPERPLDPQITQLTGLTDEMLKGQAIDDDMAVFLLSSADKVIAHNAAFDRPFIDKRLSLIADRAWACTMAEPDWLKLGFDGRTLSHLLSQCGWFYAGHRAQNDILALLYLLAHELPDGRTILCELLECSDRPSLKVNAIGAPYDAKDRLKARGYRWNPILRFWSREIREADRDAEFAWLSAEIYPTYGEPAFLPVTALDRYKRS